MTIRTLALFAASLGTLIAQGPGAAAPVGPGAVIETIRFDGVEAGKQAAILERIGVRVGDVLNAETRQRIGRELNKGEKSGFTFSYKPGAQPGTATLTISSGC